MVQIKYLQVLNLQETCFLNEGKDENSTGILKYAAKSAKNACK